MRFLFVLSVLVSAALSAPAPFQPNVRVDHQNLPNHHCLNADVAVGTGAASRQPIYVVFEDDSCAGIVPRRSDVLFQKSTDGGVTWLSEDGVICRGARFAVPGDVTTDTDGNVYVVYSTYASSSADGHVYCVRSSDGGGTWSAPARIDDGDSAGGGRIATDSAGNLFCGFGEYSNKGSHIWSSVSTDKGTTWSPNVRVCLDTADHRDCYCNDVFVQPGTNHYLLAVQADYYNFHPYLCRSTDMGRTFQPPVRLDTFEGGFSGHPHVVADRDHIICDYTGDGGSFFDQNYTEARTLYTLQDSWGPCTSVTNLDTAYSCYFSGNLAISPDGRVHAALMITYLGGNNHVYYAASADHGASWSDRAPVDDDVSNKQWPDIATDSLGYAYLVWQDWRGDGDEVWFSTNSHVGIAEDRVPQAPSVTLAAEPSVFSRTTTIRLSPARCSAGGPGRFRMSVYGACGRLVRSFALPSSPTPAPYSFTWNGSDAAGRRCTPGIYLVRAGSAAARVVLLPAE